MRRMTEIPDLDQNGNPRLVLVYDEDGSIDLGFWVDTTQTWVNLGGLSMKLVCWTYPPDAKLFIEENDLEVAYPRGYRD